MEIEKKYAEFIRRQRWAFASTMKNIPHWYIVKQKLSRSEQQIFDELVQYITDHGVKAWFYKYHFPYLYFEGFYYWACPEVDAYVINRASDETNKIINGVMYIRGVPMLSKGQKVGPQQDSFDF